MNQLRIIMIVTAVIWTIQAPTIFAQDTLVVYRLESGSRLWLEGTATVGDYTCEAGAIEGMAQLHVSSVRKYDSSSSSTVGSDVRVSILVKSFDCGNSAMNSDMYDAMKANCFPSIQYELVEATILSDSRVGDSVLTVTTSGKLTIAGVTKIVLMSISIRQLSSSRFQIIGSKTLSMHDFDITPPITLWGFIKANDKLVVNFNLVAGEGTFQPKEGETRSY